MVVRTVPAPLKSTAPPSMTMLGVEDRELEFLGDAGRHGVVIIVGRIFSAPGVEAPVDDGRLRLCRVRSACFEDERRAMIAAPAFVGLDVMEEDVRQAGSRAL